MSWRKQDAAALLKQMLEQLNSQPEAANDDVDEDALRERMRQVAERVRKGRRR